MADQPLEIKMTIPAASEYVGVIRLAISGIATRMNFTIEEIEDIKISISEACTNAIQHAYGENPDATNAHIDVKAIVHKDKLEIIVNDYGKGFDLNILGTEEQKRNSREKLGLGLGLTFIKSLMDDAEFTSIEGQGTVIRMVKNAPVTETVTAG